MAIIETYHLVPGLPSDKESMRDDASQSAIAELSRQLQQWRDHLPTTLKWVDPPAVELMSQSEQADTITLHADGVPYEMPSPSTVLWASLQTRYKFAQYMIWRPCLYKALHFPDSITLYDLNGCEQAVDVSLSSHEQI